MHEPEADTINLLIIKDQMHVHSRISGYMPTYIIQVRMHVDVVI